MCVCVCVCVCTCMFERDVPCHCCADIVYGGRVLRDSRGISDYGIKSGATLFVLKKKTTVTAASMYEPHVSHVQPP